jgi:osomolarity two-component system response regulator SSK1
MPERRLSRLLKAKLLRRSSTPAVPKTGNGADPCVHPNSTFRNPRAPQRFDSASEKIPYSVISASAEPSFDEPSPGSVPDRQGRALKPRPDEPHPTSPSNHLHHQHEDRIDTPPPTDSNLSPLHTPLTDEAPSPTSTTSLATPQHSDDTSIQSANATVRAATPSDPPLTPALETVVERVLEVSQSPSSLSLPVPTSKRPTLAVRRQSLLPASHQHLISGLLEPNQFFPGDQYGARAPIPANEMVQRRVWVKRPGGSATLVPCMEDAVVDELRDQVIMKYVNSLGRSFDSPDIVIRIHAREGSNRQHAERLLSPEEVLFSVIDSYYPGGQSIEEALVIDAPSRRTPKPSPRHTVYHHHQPGEHGDYFPLMPAQANTSPGHPSTTSAQSNAPSISVLTTGVLPPLPSPGSRGTRHHRRPPLTRHTTNSPTLHGPGVTVTGMFCPAQYKFSSTNLEKKLASLPILRFPRLLQRRMYLHLLRRFPTLPKPKHTHHQYHQPHLRESLANRRVPHHLVRCSVG